MTSISPVGYSRHAKTKADCILKDKSGAFKLRDDIKSFGYDERTGQYFAQLKKGNNYLHYNPANIDALRSLPVKKDENVVFMGRNHVNLNHCIKADIHGFIFQ